MKTCPSCGRELQDDLSFCGHCGASLLGSAPSQIPATDEPKTSGMAIASLVLGVIGFIFPAAVAAIILGHISRREIRRAAGRLKGSGLALGGLIFGYGWASVVPVLIIAAIAIPSLLRARMAANEASAVGALRSIYSAATAYRVSFGMGFPPELASLGPPERGGKSSDRAGLLQPDLAAGRWSGYVFSYRPVSRVGTTDGFQVNADPAEPNQSGRRHFFVDDSGVIRSSEDNPATMESPPL